MYGLEPTNGAAYNAYMPILQSAFAGSGSGGTTTATSTTSSRTTSTTARTTSTTTTTRTTSSPSPTGNCASKWSQCGVGISCKSRKPPQNADDSVGQRMEWAVLLRERQHLPEVERLVLAVPVSKSVRIESLLEVCQIISNRTSCRNGISSLQCKIANFP